MTTIVRSEDRGHSDIGWLDSRHSFSFADYYNPERMGFRSLRVINDDWIGAGGGFPTHPHRDMEILTYVLEGAVQHQDSMGHGEVIPSGDLQRMTAGTGIAHSEFNASAKEPLHLYQIWILPDRRGRKPEYEQRSLAGAPKPGEGLKLIASPDGRDGSMTIHQDAQLYLARLTPGETVRHKAEAGRGLWLQTIKGDVKLNGRDALTTGDAAAIEEDAEIAVEASTDAEILLFDLA